MFRLASASRPLCRLGFKRTLSSLMNSSARSSRFPEMRHLAGGALVTAGLCGLVSDSYFCDSDHSSRVVVLDQKVHSFAANSIKRLLTIIRDERTAHADFSRAIDSLNKMVLQLAIGWILDSEGQSCRVMCPTGHPFDGLELGCGITAVSILRSGDAMLSSLLDIEGRGQLSIGKVLVSRDAGDPVPRLYYSKLPTDIAASKRKVLLLDPLLASGATACVAIEELKCAGVDEADITYVCLIGCQEGLERLTSKFASVKVVAATVDMGLDERKFLIPGLGRFGDRFWGTHS